MKKICMGSGGNTIRLIWGRRTARVLLFALAAALLVNFTVPPVSVYARDGIGGFDGVSISAGELPNRTRLDCQEYIFLTGEPILVRGWLEILKEQDGNNIVTKYRYNLTNPSRTVRLIREEWYETVNSPKENGQIVTETSLYTNERRSGGGGRNPSEKIITEYATYTLRNMDFTRTSLVDTSPGVNYYSGNTWYRKQYEIGGGWATSESGNFIMVEATGQFYGYDQSWGNADVEETELLIEHMDAAASGDADGVGTGTGDMPGTGNQNWDNEEVAANDAGNEGDEDNDTPDADAAAGVSIIDEREDLRREYWSGTVNVRRSQSVVTELRYVENAPTAISFRGGFLETRSSNNVLEFDARFPEFTSDRYATDRIKSYKNSAQISTFPSTKRLISPDLRQIRGHWAEEAVSKLFGMEIFSRRPSEFMPDQYITRAEFAAALTSAVPAVPADPYIATRGGTRQTGLGAAAPAEPTFTDVPANHAYFAPIEEIFARGLMNPADKNAFAPNDKISVSDAAVAFIRALGLESLATAHNAITEYADDADIPAYARDALYVAQLIGLLRGDGGGNIYPSRELTKAEAAVMIDRLVEYMRTDLKADYRDRLMDY